MEYVIVTIFISNIPFRFNVYIDEKEESTTYHVSAKDMGNGQIDVPEQMKINVDGVVTVEMGTLTAKQAQTAHLVWEEILKKLDR